MLLPSTRVMARLLGVSRNTMLAVYDDLSADGLITAERGGGMRVNKAGKAGGLMAGLHHVIQAARYPARVVSREDPDENSLYIRF
jgi:DNA-binding transcriptional regulator YhcF (GntR family)